MIVIITLVISEIFDIVWFIIVWNPWTVKLTNSVPWNSMSVAHEVVLWTSIVNCLIKVVCIIKIFIEKREETDKRGPLGHTYANL